MKCLKILRNYNCLVVMALMAGILCTSNVAAQDKYGVQLDDKGYYYVVKKGDTLWDISRKLHDSPYYWPALWEHSHKAPITNPHVIYPGQIIRLARHPDGFSNMPISPAQSMEPVETGSQPADRSAGQAEMAKQSNTPFYLYASIDSAGFLRNPPVPPHGVIFKVRGDADMISKHDLVFIKQLGPEPLALGEHYTVYRTLGLPDDQATEQFGIQHYFTGIIEITKIEPEYAVGKVTKSYRSMALGDYLTPYEKRDPRIQVTPSAPNLMGHILFPEDRQELVGDSAIVFIDRGTEDGVKPGQFYNIFYTERGRLNAQNDEKIFLDYINYGKVIVLLAQQRTATALVTYTEEAIPLGAGVRSPGE